LRVGWVRTSAGFRRPGPRSPLPLNRLRGENRQTVGRIGDVRLAPHLRRPVAGMVPGIERQPRKKLEPSREWLLGLLHRWRDEAVRAGRTITVVLAAVLAVVAAVLAVVLSGRTR